MQINPQYLQRDVNLIRLQSRSFYTCSHLVVYCQVREVSSSPPPNLPSQTNIVEYTLEKNGQKQCCIIFYGFIITFSGEESPPPPNLSRKAALSLPQILHRRNILFKMVYVLIRFLNGRWSIYPQSGRYSGKALQFCYLLLYLYY